MTKKAVYTGSFNPITNGHMDIIRQSLSFVDELVIAMGYHSYKDINFISIQDRSELIMQSINDLLPEHLTKISVFPFKGLAVDCVRNISAKVIIRGLRNVTDFDYEMGMAFINRSLLPEVPTITLFANESSHYISSTLVRHLFLIGEDITPFVPYPVACFLKDNYKKIKEGSV
ncbi:pantetheine-phosphate adenylyltransferase [Candidatus Liberibacter americanus]|nr:pantetheine-phosphate adenylyltransferase [Candidatus Liberibacter americanus]EMS36173.1 phosphopantetheine adenylyltransferase [Candidatus Liberibacter americanus PW_SP]